MSKNDGEERIGPLNMVNEHLTEEPGKREQRKDDDNTLEDAFEEIDTLTQDLRTKQSVYGSTVGSYITSSTGSNYCDDESQDPASDSITVLDDDMKKKLAIKTSAAVSLPGAYDSNNEGIIPKPSQQHLVQIAMLRNEQKMRPQRNNEVGGPIIGPEFEGQHLEDFQGRMNGFIGHANNEDEERQLEQNTKRRRRRCRLLATCVGVLVAIIGIIVGVIVVGGSDNGGDLDKTKSSGASKLCSVNENEVPKSEEQYHELRAWIISRSPYLDVSISTAGSSARKSLCWLAYDDNLKIGVEHLEGYHVVERFALVLIYFHFLDGAAGSELSALSTSNWLTGISVCEWDFLSCEENVVKRILFRSKIPNLGTIPPELTLLSEVVEIDISSNFLTGEIPAELWTMMQLESLSLEFNELTGTFPTEVTDLVGLKELRFGNDLLTGTLPDLSVLTDMEVLRVTHSKVFGQFPDISGCTNLEYLYFSNVATTGRLPTYIGSLSKLSSFQIVNTKISGEIPTELGNLSNLTLLMCSTGFLSGNIPSELGNLTKLTELNLGFTDLTGTIPTELGRLSNLESLDALSSPTFLEGTMPSEICSLGSLSLKYLAVDCRAVSCDCCTYCRV